ncbi:hypothetical protein SAMN05720354_106147 [Nitrosospira sp. Nsp1]|nr:hypothetical protein SAMN05720354_106147 [Nitrosospira sp. Nsp1]
MGVTRIFFASAKIYYCVCEKEGRRSRTVSLGNNNNRKVLLMSTGLRRVPRWPRLLSGLFHRTDVYGHECHGIVTEDITYTATV